MQVPTTIDRTPKYISIDTIIKLADQDKSHSEIARIVGCTPQNISARLAELDYNGFKSLREDKAKVFERLQWQIAKSIEPEDIKSMAVRDRIMGVAILQDKISVLRGLPSEITLNVNVLKRLDDSTIEIRKALEAITIDKQDDVHDIEVKANDNASIEGGQRAEPRRRGRPRKA